MAEQLTKTNDAEIKAREESLSRILLAYCDLCVAHEKTNRGLQALYFYVDRARRNPNAPKVLNIRVYNCLIEGFAAKGNYAKVGETLAIMKREHVEPNVQTYVGIFECLGRLPEDDTIKLMESHYHEMRSRVSDNLSLLWGPQTFWT